MRVAVGRLGWLLAMLAAAISKTGSADPAADGLWLDDDPFWKDDDD